ncbi:unnamed protein product [Anisakis simplex]|uniref:Syntaxin-6_N domain-containing protein n=1 Tax=Anisakis simplex TaxID=6269 RepID=A0A0M3K0J5_ANISI|nr:unnamed protein product [Anisakis simplex]
MSSDDPDTAFRSQLLVAEAEIRKISRHITQLDDSHAAWISAIQQLRPAERTVETDNNRNATITSDNFLFILERARNALDDLQTAKVNLELRIGRSTSPAGIVSSGSVPVNTNDQSGSVPVNTNNHSRCVPVNTSNRIPMQPNNHLINLPRLQIAKFDGDYRGWPQFWATFEHAIDIQPITDVEKVEGRALEAVAGYTVAPSITSQSSKHYGKSLVGIQRKTHRRSAAEQSLPNKNNEYEFIQRTSALPATTKSQPTPRSKNKEIP